MLSRIFASSVRPLGADPVADFFAFQDEGFGNAVQQHLVPLVAESAACGDCGRMRTKATSACNSMRSPQPILGSRFTARAQHGSGAARP